MIRANRLSFKRQVKKRLIDLDKPQSWLIEKVQEDTGLFVDSAYLSKIWSGERSPEKIITSIRKILDLSDDAQKGEI